MQEIPTSIIIPTYNGSKRLPRLIDSLVAQTVMPDEVIIVIDGSSDNTEEYLKSLTVPFQLRIITQENKGRATARNTGVKNSLGSLLIFVDDDIAVESDFIEQHIKMHIDYPDSICGGKTSQEIVNEENYDFYCFRAYQEDSWVKNYPRDTIVESDSMLSTQQLSVKKDIFFKIGFFDEKLTDSEDFDLGVRAKKLGIPSYYSPHIKVLHRDTANLRQYIKRQVEYKIARKKLAVLHPEYVDVYTEHFPQISENKIKLVFRKFFHLNRLWESFIKSFLFKLFLSKSMRYTIYDYIISSTVYYEVKRL